MKKSIVLFLVACAAYSIVLLASGIYIFQFDLAASFVNMLVEKTSYVGLILVIILYIPIVLMRIICYIFMYFGVCYLLIFARTLFVFCKNDLPQLQKLLRALNVSNCCLLVLLFMSDCVIIPYIFTHIQNDVSVPLIIFTILINVTAIAFEVTDVFAIRKIKQLSA